MLCGEQEERHPLPPLIFANVETSSTICSDQWSAYATLGNFFAAHNTVNHSKHFVDPTDCTINTQTVERVWREAKSRLLIKLRGVPFDHLQSHLEFFCILYEFKNDDPFVIFMKIIGNILE